MIDSFGLKTIEEVFSSNVKSLRGKRSQQSIADAMGITVRTYQTYEAEVIPQGPNRSALVKALGTTETRLFLDSELIAEMIPADIAEALTSCEASDWDVIRIVLRGTGRLAPQAPIQIPNVPAESREQLDKLNRILSRVAAHPKLLDPILIAADEVDQVRVELEERKASEKKKA